MTNKDFKNAGNPLEDADMQGPTIEEADAMLFGDTGIKVESGRVTAYPVEIFKLFADPTQPRRAIPIAIRGDWDGKADQVPGLLQHWHAEAEKELSQDIDVSRILKGYDGERPEIDAQTPPVAYQFVQLIDLAYSIHSTRLQHPIQYKQMGVGGMVYVGERRWLAFHALVIWSDNPQKYKQIPAVAGDFDRWEQAIENFARSDLNAISRARQLALLLMDIHTGQDEKEFDSYKALVSPGGCDRAFYAQVANGYQYHTRGFTDKILTATGLSNPVQISQYRNLLNLSDEEWVEADKNNYTENYCRENFLRKSPKGEPEDEGKGLTVVKPLEADSPSPTVKIGQIRAMYDDSDVPYVEVLEQVGTNMYQCRVVYLNSDTVEKVSGSKILHTWWRILASEPSLEEEKGDTDDIKPGQIRARHADSAFPYMKVQKYLGRGDWNIAVTNSLGTNNQIVSDKAIRQYWSIILPGIPESPEAYDSNRVQTPPSSEMANIPPGVPDVEHPKGVEIPLGNGIPDYPHGDDDDTFDQPQRRPHPIYGHGDKDDDGERIPLIATYEKLKRLHSNLRSMAMNLNMKEQDNRLAGIYRWTPAYIKALVEKEGLEAWQAEVSQMEAAYKVIWNNFVAEFEELVGDTMEVAEKAVDDDS